MPAIRSRIASETAYGGWADATTSHIRLISDLSRGNPQQGLGLSLERHAQIYARHKHVTGTEFCPR